MKLGIKVGLLGNSYQDLLETHPDFCEIWFHSGKIDEYDNLFSQIKKVGCANGLHFWGALPDGTLANFSYPDATILAASRKLMLQTLETAAKQGSFYVNIHPAAHVLSKIDFKKETLQPYSPSASIKECLENLQESLEMFLEYGKRLGVSLYIESVPSLALGKGWLGKKGRLRPTDIGELTISEIEPILTLPELYFTNDFGHTSGNITSNDRSQIKEFLFNTTKRLATKTKLIHAGYIIPPYNGTDYHGCLYYDEFSTKDAIPNRIEIQELLSLFKGRDDVGVLVEPEKDHPGNFRYLKNLINELD